MTRREGRLGSQDSETFCRMALFHSFQDRIFLLGLYRTMLPTLSKRKFSPPPKRRITLLFCVLASTFLTLYYSTGQGKRHLASVENKVIYEEDEEAVGRRATYLYHNILDQKDNELNVEPSINNHVRKRRALPWSLSSWLFWLSGSTPETCPDPLAPPPLPGKKGIGFTLRDKGQEGSWEDHMPRVQQLNVSWNYSWNWKRIPQQIDSSEFVPMIWGRWNTQQRINDDVIPQYNAGLTKRLLGFNEPDMDKQANMSVEEAVDMWEILENTNIPLASPSFGHSDRDWAIDWFAKTDEMCLRQEMAALHWYKGPNADMFKREMQKAYELYGGQLPLLITEFAVADWTARSLEDNRYSTAQVLEFAKIVIPWMEQQDWILGYAWFSFKQNWAAGTSSALYDTDGVITPLGEYYASVTPENIFGDQSIQYS